MGGVLTGKANHGDHWHDEAMVPAPANGVSGDDSGSKLSYRSRNSLLSIGSRDSLLSIGSVGSVLSIGSIGSAGSVLSIASFASVLSVMSGASAVAVMSWRAYRRIGSGASIRSAINRG